YRKSSSRCRRFLSAQFQLLRPPRFWKAPAPARGPRECPRESSEFPPLSQRQGRGDHVPRDLAFALKEPEKLVARSIHGHQFCHWLPPLGNHHNLALLLHLVHRGEALRLEITRRHCPRFHGLSFFMTIVT